MPNDHAHETAEQLHLFDPEPYEVKDTAENDRVAEEDSKLEAAGVDSPDVQVAFLVILRRDGQWTGTSHLEVAPLLEPARPASMADFIHGCRAVEADASHRRSLSDLVTNLANLLPNMTAAALAERAQAAQRAMMEEAQKEQIRKLLAQGGKL